MSDEMRATTISPSELVVLDFWIFRDFRIPKIYDVAEFVWKVSVLKSFLIFRTWSHSASASQTSQIRFSIYDCGHSHCHLYRRRIDCACVLYCLCLSRLIWLFVTFHQFDSIRHRSNRSSGYQFRSTGSKSTNSTESTWWRSASISSTP